MSASIIHPVLLCGGAGTRLWPASRQSYPKQFTPLFDDKSLYQHTAARLRHLEAAAPIVVTTHDFRFIVKEQLAAQQQTAATTLVEPEARNTAPAILAAALHLEARFLADGRTDDPLMLITPTDHLIPDIEAFKGAIDRARPAAEAGQIVTFGIIPDRPETGFGWLALSAPLATAGHEAQPLDGFVEKPDLATAESLLQSGTHLWNAGIFFCKMRTLINTFAQHQPKMLDQVRAAVDGAQSDLHFTRLAPDPWRELEDLSIDYAIMERADHLWVVPFTGTWSDLGWWDAVWREMGPDRDGVARAGPATALECSNTLLRSEAPHQQIVGIGLENMIAIAMPDAVLVAPLDRAQDVKAAVSALKAKDVSQAVQHPRDYRPWGWYDRLVTGGRFQVKRIHVNPGAALSLQSHHHRAEHWIVVEGTASVTVDGEKQLVSENQSIYIPLGARHRLENPGKMPMVLIEVQTGSYLGEDDILRHEDLYARG